MTDEKWLTVTQISEHLGVRKDTVYDWISGRGMPAHRVGRFWRFRAAEVDEWVRSGQAGEADPPAKAER